MPLTPPRPLSRLAVLLLAAALGVPAVALAQGEESLSAPVVLSRVDAHYPEGPPPARDVLSVLLVTVGVDGSVEEVATAESGGKEYDRAAREAVIQWKFRPAQRDGQPVRARIRIPFTFPAGGVGTAPGAASSATVPASSSIAVPPSGSASGPFLVPASSSSSAPIPAPSGSSSPAGMQSATAGQAAAAAKALQPDPAVRAADTQAPQQVVIVGRSRPPSRGASDFQIDLGKLREVPRKNAAEMLQLAPGILLTNEGGEGHAHQVFLRGFDAREGQDIEFTVGGVPVNEAGNLHGNGHADTHFIIPEVVHSLRVVEGPFDPRQGNFAVAGSADYELGLDRRGTTIKYTRGSYGTDRLLLLWGPRSQGRGTFGAAELFDTAGFGQNRDARRGSAMGQYEGKLGDKGAWRLTGQGYSASYHSAGVLREDAYRRGLVGFYDTHDFRQGGDASRFSIAGDLEQTVDDMRIRQQVYVIRNAMRMRKNYTGFLLDVQEPLQNPHAQRGDGIDLQVDSWTLGAKGSSRSRTVIGGLPQELEVGYSARADYGSGTQLRVQSSNAVPYGRDTDVEYSLGDIGLYGDLNVRPLSWLTFRGGLRGDLFTYNVLDRCAQDSVRQPSRTNPPGDASCLDQQDFGRYRDPTQRASTSQAALLPRASVIVGPFHGMSLSSSWGEGVRSIDPVYISQDLGTPFARVRAWESGVTFGGGLGNTHLVSRAVFFRTHVERDLVFSETAGRNTLADGTTRTGGLLSGRWSGSWFDQNANVTVVRSTFDDTNLLVPYVPDLVVRYDGSVHHDLPWRPAGRAVRATVGTGVTWVGHRPLPYGQRSDTLFTVDLSGSLAWRNYEVGVAATNVLNRRYRLGEFNYASDFQTEAQPTLVPVRHFTAGPPRMLFLTLGVNFGGPE